MASGSAQATAIFVDTTFDRSAWEASAGGAITTDPFDNDIPQSNVLDFDSGIQSVAEGLNQTANHRVMEGRFQGTLSTAGSTAPGYLSFTWDFGEPVISIGADFFSIGGSREVSVQGIFDAGQEAFDLRTVFIADGGLDQGFSASPPRHPSRRSP